MTIKTVWVAFVCHGWVLAALVGCNKAGNGRSATDGAADVLVVADATLAATGGSAGGDGSRGSSGGAAGTSDVGLGGSTGGNGDATGGSGGSATTQLPATGGAGGIATADGASGGAGNAARGGAGGGGATGRADAASGGAPIDGGVFDVGSAGGTGGGLSTGGVGGTGGSAATACPSTAPTQGSSCNYSGTASCYYEDCAGSGRTLANCQSGTWQVTTGACTTVSCQGTCALGQLCLRIQSGYLTKDCVTPTCGTGPVTPACVPGVRGTCSVSASISAGADVECSYCSGTGGCQ